MLDEINKHYFNNSFWCLLTINKFIVVNSNLNNVFLYRIEKSGQIHLLETLTIDKVGNSQAHSCCIGIRFFNIKSTCVVFCV